ncbi:hypothetical protein BZZ01_28890 [Nostocales cyanobacterium HT-58-2]|nr:hypothetical protein BZZ01_28890 [Nostocales cyanobacterium HT-58-2]
MIPLIFGAVALGSAAFGAIAGAAGIADINEAKEIDQRTQKRYENAVSNLEAEWETINKLAQEYGQLQLDVMMHTIGRFVHFIERNSDQAQQSEQEFLKELEGISVQQLKVYKAAVMEAKHFFIGDTNAITAAGYIGAMSLATSVGMVSTGTAAWNTTLASLGDGSFAADGTSKALGVGEISSAILIGGLEGENTLTKAREYEAKVNIAIVKIDAVKDCMQQVRRRITELRNLFGSLNNRAVVSLKELEFLPSFNRHRDTNKFQQVALLVKALAEIMKTPVLDNEDFALKKVNLTECWQQAVSVYTDYLKVAEQEKKKQQKIEIWEKETIAKINLQRERLKAYLELWFGDHAGNFRTLFAVIDSASLSGNNENISISLNTIAEIAKADPFTELANLAYVRALLITPDHK